MSPPEGLGPGGVDQSTNTKLDYFSLSCPTDYRRWLLKVALFSELLGMGPVSVGVSLCCQGGSHKGGAQAAGQLGVGGGCNREVGGLWALSRWESSVDWLLHGWAGFALVGEPVVLVATIR